MNINSKKITDVICNLCKQANIFISKDVYEALFDSYNRENSQRAKSILSEILENIKLAAETRRPICQDTGIVVVFIEVGQEVRIHGKNIEDAINDGVEKAYSKNNFRKSIIKDPLFERVNTNTNTPAIIYTGIVEGDTIRISLSIKGCGSENMSAVKMLKPSSDIDDIVGFITDTIKNAGSNTCPPVRLGIGIGGTMEYAALLSKKALLKPLKTEKELIELSTEDRTAEFELKILREVNKLDIGAGGLGGKTTAFGVNVLLAPTHIAAMPVAVNINCHASRHARAEIFKDQIKYYSNDYQYNFDSVYNADNNGKRVSADEISVIRNLKAGENILLNGYIYTARDAAHKKLKECLDNGKELPIDVKDKIIYYTGPCPPADGEIIGPAGPTTSSRMDKYTPELLKRGLLATIGKGTRSDLVIDSIKKNNSLYMVNTGGAAVFLANCITESQIVAYPELGPEAIYKLKVKDFPVTVGIDGTGKNILK